VSTPELVYGPAGLEPRKAIDIVLVSDGFTAASMSQFRTVVEAFKSQLTTFTSSHGNEPYFSFRSAIRIWKMEVPSAVPGHLSHRVVTGYDDVPSGSRKTALANLERLGRIGLKAETVDADVLVFMSDRATFGGAARAMAMGSVVMLPVSGSSAAADGRLDFADRTSSITVLAGTWRGYHDKDFGEPYSSVLGPGLYRDLAPSYHGKEPQAPNVTAEKPSAAGAAPRKWARWAQNPTMRPP
jgi:hypothetical protein